MLLVFLLYLIFGGVWGIDIKKDGVDTQTCIVKGSACLTFLYAVSFNQNNTIYNFGPGEYFEKGCLICFNNFFF
jgi:hypothetical protein